MIAKARSSVELLQALRLLSGMPHDDEFHFKSHENLDRPGDTGRDEEWTDAADPELPKENVPRVRSPLSLPTGFEAMNAEPACEPRRVLVAGIGNIYLGDAGFGVAVARRLLARPLPADLVVKDFGVNAVELACALRQGYAAVILVDLLPRRRIPGSLCILTPDEVGRELNLSLEIDGHAVNPADILLLAGRIGESPPLVLLAGCEPTIIRDPKDAGSIAIGMSCPVADAVEAAANLVLEQAEILLNYPKPCRTKGIPTC